MMNEPIFINLDATCARFGQEIAVSAHGIGLEKVITNGMAVLDEQGVYALFLYLAQEDTQQHVSVKLQSLLSEIQDLNFVNASKQANLFGAIRTLSENLDRLIFARDFIASDAGVRSLPCENATKKRLKTRRIKHNLF